MKGLFFITIILSIQLIPQEINLSKYSKYDFYSFNSEHKSFFYKGTNQQENLSYLAKSRIYNSFSRVTSDSILLMEIIQKNCNEFDCYNCLKNKYVYDKDNNLIEWQVQGWRDSSWVISERTFMTYDMNKNIIEELTYIGLDSIWNPAWIILNKFDQNHNLIEQIEQDYKDSSWLNLNRNTRTYDNNSNLIEFAWQKWEDSEWVNVSTTISFFDEKNNRIEDIFQKWDDNSWINDGKTDFIFDTNNNIAASISSNWSGSNWVISSEAMVTYSHDFKEEEWLYKTWTDSTWVNEFKYIFYYDDNHNTLKELWQDWDGSNWINYCILEYIYSSLTTVENNKGKVTDYKLFNNFPNPFNPSTVISYQLAVSSKVVIKLFNSLGQEVETIVNEFQPAGFHSKLFTTYSSLPSGIYFYKLEAGSFSSTKKMILMK